MAIVAEIGSNHLGDLGRAKEMINIIADCGADFAKFQFFKKEQYPQNIETPIEWLGELKKTCNDRNIGFLFSVFYCDKLLANSIPLVKISFSQRYNFDLMNFYKGEGCKLIVSGNEKTYFHDKDCIKLYCVPKYPATLEDYKSYIPSSFGFNGVSDHTPETTLFSKGLWYEKHFKLGDEEDSSLDAGNFAITPHELKELCQQ